MKRATIQDKPKRNSQRKKQQQPKPSLTKPPSKPAPQAPVPPVVLVAYKLVDGNFIELKFIDRDGRIVLEESKFNKGLHDPNPDNESEKIKWSGIDRVVFYRQSKDNSPLLLFDTLPNETSIELRNNKVLTLTLRIRCLLVTKNRIDLEIILQKTAALESVKFIRFRYKDEDLTIINPDLISAPTTTEQLGPILSSTTTTPTEFRASKTGGLSLKFRDSIDLQLRTKTCDGEKQIHTKITYAKRKPQTLEFYVIKFTVEVEDTSCGQAEGTKNLKAFSRKFHHGEDAVPHKDDDSQELEKDSKFGDRLEYRLRIDQDLLQDKKKVWRIVQQPPQTIQAGAKFASTQLSSQRAAVAQWLLSVDGVPADSIPLLWQRFARLYWDSIRTVLSGRPISYLPELCDFPRDNSPKPTDPEFLEPCNFIEDAELNRRKRWTMVYQVVDESPTEDTSYSFGHVESGKTGLYGFALQPAEDGKFAGRLVRLKTHENKSLECIIRTGNSTITPIDPVDGNIGLRRGIFLFCDKPITTAKTEQSVRMGALDLRFDTTREDPSANQNYFNILLPQEQTNDRYPTVDILANFAVRRVGPGGQDQLPGEEFVPEGASNLGVDPCAPLIGSGQLDPSQTEEREIELAFRRKSPIVIDWRSLKTPDDPFLLLVTENAQQGSNQTIRLEIKNNKQKTDSPPAAMSPCGESDLSDKVIILDRNPFLVAVVEYKPFTRQDSRFGSSTIANWTNAGIEGANWQLLTRAEPFNLVLPPQSVGEDMEKSFPGETTDNGIKKGFTIEKDKRAAFRLSTNACAKLEPEFFQQNFNEAPWNLRRILGYPGQRAPGAAIKLLQFELIYGLSCEINYPFLRLAEISAMIGGIAGRLQQFPHWSGLPPTDSAYKNARKEWSMLYKRYLARLAVLEPWDTHRQQNLTLSEGMICRIRKNSADLRPPIDSPQIPANDQGLKGGVTWGFESRNIYNAVMQPTRPADPQADPAAINSLYLSSLGGWGRQQVSFDQKRTTIYADTSMGRTYSYKLERIGRIACMWNRAKHVIVFERSVVPSRQFGPLQLRHEGRPLLRKVKEYVEILEDSRSYPDGKPAASKQEEDALKRQCGFVNGCTFAKGARFNVLSSWGTDVEDIGWKVPIWKPGAIPADVYPRPDVKLDLLSNVNGSSVPAPCSIKNPENIYFYTDTRATTGSDPDKWPPVKGVDYVDLPRPAALEDFGDGRPISTTPNDVSVPPGFSPCTFTLESPIAPADLVASRVGEPLAAVLESVTVARAGVLAKVGNVREEMDKLIKLDKSVSSAFQELLQQIPTNPDAYTAGVISALKQRITNSFDQAAGSFRKVQDDLTRIQTELDNKKAQFLIDLENAEKQLYARMVDQVKAVLEDRFSTAPLPVLREYGRIRDEIQNGTITTVAQFKSRVNQRLHALQEGVLLLRASPGLLQRQVRTYAEAARHLLLDLKVKVDEMVADLGSSTEPVLSAAELAQLQSKLRQIINTANELIGVLNNVASSRPEDWIPEVFPYVDEVYLKPLKDAYALKLKPIEETILNAVDVRRATARDLLNALSSYSADINAKIAELGSHAKDFLKEALDQLTTAWITEQQQLVNALTEASTAADMVRVIDDLIPYIDEANTTAKNIFKRLNEANVLLQAKTAILRDWPFEAVKKLKAALDNLKKDTLLPLIADVAELRKKLEEQRDIFFKKAGQYLDQNIGLLRKDAENIFATAGSIYEPIRLIRAFGRPPEVPNLSFDRPAIAYFYREADDVIGLTPILSRVNQANAIIEALKPIGIALPTNQLKERLIPAALQKFKLSDILPKFAGLDLSNLFSGVKMPEMSNENVKVKHGLDPQTRRAWVETSVDVQLGSQPTTIFSVGPLALRLSDARFQGNARVEAGVNEPPKRIVTGRISGTWELVIGGMTMVRFRNTELRFDDAGGLRFSLSPQNVELPGILSFVQDFLKSFSKPDSGFSVGLLPTGFQAVLNLPIPDIQVGAFGMSNLILGMIFRLQFADEDFGGDFTISVAFNLGRKEAPFALTIFILGGGGYIDITTTYAPSQQKLASRVEVGITACASLAVAFGPIKGGVYVYLGINVTFRTSPSANGNRGLTFGVMLLIRGEVSILSIVSASISLLLEAQYSSGQLVGRGRLSISIKICWCFTLEINEEVSYTVGAGSSSARMDRRPSQLLAANHNPYIEADPDALPFTLPALSCDAYTKQASEYITLLMGS